MDTAGRIGFFLEMMACCNDVAYWCFNREYKLVSSNGKDGESFFCNYVLDGKMLAK